MASPLNVEFSLADAGMVVIPVNRWGPAQYSVQIETGGTVLVEGTLTQVNRADPVTKQLPVPVWAVVNDNQGAPINAAPVGITNFDFVPLEAVRLTATGAVSGRFMQQGEVS